MFRIGIWRFLFCCSCCFLDVGCGKNNIRHYSNDVRHCLNNIRHRFFDKRKRFCGNARGAEKRAFA